MSEANPVQNTSNKSPIIDAAPSAAAIAAGGGVWAFATKAALATALTAAAAGSTLLSGSWLPTVAATTLTGLDATTDFPVVRTATAVTAGIAALAATKMGISITRAAKEIVQRTVAAVKAVTKEVVQRISAAVKTAANFVSGSNRPAAVAAPQYGNYRMS